MRGRNSASPPFQPSCNPNDSHPLDRQADPALPDQTSLRDDTCLAWRLHQRRERGVYAASALDNPKGPAKFLSGGTAQTLKRPEGRAPAANGASLNTYPSGAIPNSTNQVVVPENEIDVVRNRSLDGRSVSIPEVSAGLKEPKSLHIATP